MESEAEEESNSSDSMGSFIVEDNENESHDTGDESEQVQLPTTKG